jgi:hypothetical protein
VQEFVSVFLEIVVDRIFNATGFSKEVTVIAASTGVAAEVDDACEVCRVHVFLRTIVIIWSRQYD